VPPSAPKQGPLYPIGPRCVLLVVAAERTLDESGSTGLGMS